MKQNLKVSNMYRLLKRIVKNIRSPINMYRLLKRIVKNMLSPINAKKVLRIFPDANPKEYSNQVTDIKRIDRYMIGRYCGSLEDKVMQSMSCYGVASRFPSDRQYAHVEIGVLFGGSILAKLSVLRRLNKEQTFVAIDPFEGYYQNPEDHVTGIEVSDQNFRENIQKFGFDNETIQIIKKYSRDEQVKSVLSEYKVISLMIDGDHTFDGVRNDWEMYSDMVEPGGHVIFDDYENPVWPDVTRFVNELINSKPQAWEIFGKLGTTLIFKRI